MKDVLEDRKRFLFLTLKEYQKVHLSLCAQITAVIMDVVKLLILVAIEDYTRQVFFPPDMFALTIKPFIVI